MNDLTKTTRVPSRAAGLLLLFLTMGIAVPLDTAAQLSGIRYTIAPRADRVLFDDNAGLSDATTVSGRLGFGFGEYLDLSAFGRYAPTMSTDFSRYDEFGDPGVFQFDQVRPRDVELLQYGLDLKGNLATGGPFIPYVSIGTGILSLNPDGLDRTETIYLGGTVGILYRWQDRVTFTVEAQRQVWRMNAAALLSGADLTDLALARRDFSTSATGAYAFGAGISFDLGGRAPGEQTELDRALSDQFGRGFSAVRLQVEPFGGTLNFSESLGFANKQRMSGLNAGLDLGPYIGVRGFYWRGIEEEGSLAFDELSAYGGELILRFGTPNRNVRPHLLLGGGYLNVLEGYEGNGIRNPEDTPFAMAGGGVSVQTGRFFSLHGGVRSLLASAENASDVSTPSSVEANWMYYAGISFELGRDTGFGRRGQDPAPGGQMTEDTEESAEIQALRAELEQQRKLIAALAGVDTTASMVDTTAFPAGHMMTRAGAMPSQRSGGRDWVALPVPEEGEIYIRFGPPAASTQDAVYFLDPVTGELRPALSTIPATADTSRGLTAAEVRAMARQTAQEVASASRQPAARVDTTAIAAFTRRMEARLGELDARLDALGVGENRATTEQVVEMNSQVSRPFRARAILPLTGFNLTDPQTLLLGGRVEMARDESPFKVLTDVVIGLGSETTWSFGANAVTGFEAPFLSGASFYAGPGVGFLSADDTQLVLNLLVGAHYPMGSGSIFGEFLTQDLFDNNRIQVGYRISLE